VTLKELQACCDEFLVLDPDDRFTVQLREATGDHVLPPLETHRRALFLWLRQWGCRQFAKQDEALSHESLLAWWVVHETSLPPPDTHLHEIGDDGLHAIADAYNDLRTRTAAYQRRRSGLVTKGFGPAGAAKALHAIRPRACPPWDIPIRKALGFTDDARGYRAHLHRMQRELEEAAADLPPGHGIADIPAAIGRPGISPVKLVDEHDWVRFTRGFAPPAA
jgi:hypothetical protein